MTHSLSTIFAQLVTSSNPYLYNLALHMGENYQIYYSNSGDIFLNNPPPVEEIVNRVEDVGMWIPFAYRGTPNEALFYMEKYGELYSFTSRNVPQYQLNDLLYLFSGNDVYLNPFLRAQLEDLTDFDLIDLFIHDPNLLYQFENRTDIIDYVFDIFHPAGTFTINYSNDNIHIVVNHTYKGREISYINDGAEKMARNGKLYFEFIELPSIGLYQIAFEFQRILFEPLSPEQKQIADELYDYFLGQIRFAEKYGAPRYRFSELFDSFNADIERRFSLFDLASLKI